MDAVITIPNERLLALVPRGASLVEAFKTADDLLRQAVEGIGDIINATGAINRGFADIKAIMAGMGYAMMGTATAEGGNAAVDAARLAIGCPLLEDTRIAGARRILINITGSSSLGFHEVNEACTLIREAAQSPEVQLSFGVIQDETMGDKVKVTVIATGVQQEKAQPADWRASAPAAVAPAPPEPPAPQLAPQPEPEVVAEEALIAEAEPPIDLEDLDTPAYLRQGRLLN